MVRYAIAIEYDGAGFCGWQRQHHSPSVQQTLEQAISKVADHAVTLVCAGRTDTGVHALAQIAHFDTTATRVEAAWLFGVNSNLNSSVAVHWARPMPAGFHARYSATARRYRYTILNRRSRAGMMNGFAAWENRPLDADSMHAAAQHLVGSHDFSAFRSADCQSPHARRTLFSIRVWRHGDFVIVDIHGNAFLHNMVRIIVGSLIKVGRADRPVEWIAGILEAKDRRLAGKTAAACGLCFIQSDYPLEYGIPVFPVYWPDGGLTGGRHSNQCDPAGGDQKGSTGGDPNS